MGSSKLMLRGYNKHRLSNSLAKQSSNPKVARVPPPELPQPTGATALYLLTRLPKTEARKEFETHALEHVMSFQRRVVACKREFLARQKKTPLGIVEDYWDRFSVSNC